MGGKAITECCTIGITSYGRLSYTKQCIESLHKTKGQYPFKIVVVNNYKQGEDEAIRWLKNQLDLGRIDDLCLMERNVGISKACNAAWTRYPNNKYFLKLDNDMVAKKVGWLDKMIGFVNRHPTFGILGYNVEPVYYPLNFESVRVISGCLGGACVLISKYVENSIGYYNEQLGNPYSEEDYDFVVRVRLRGMNAAYMGDQECFLHLPAGKAGSIDPNFYVHGLEAELETEYRTWKDYWRRKSISTRDACIAEYHRNISSTYIGTNASEEFKSFWC